MILSITGQALKGTKETKGYYVLIQIVLFSTVATSHLWYFKFN